ncbi:arginase [Psittacicella hinzii]|uniref:Arginase n=1 Tax=Psittacicella hinzii TaxID=2028575 RepID=A0A3A1Y8M7_9GAMM|nr:arginase family protein [Psittacicella hinzii]RIY34542.1 arginase [Psittacicella hinzii]
MDKGVKDSTDKTLRVIVPDWQGGNNPLYTLGANLLAFLAPENANQETVTVKTQPVDAPVQQQNGVNAQAELKEYISEFSDLLAQKQPSKVITFGGSCLVSQAPFDYLSGKYGDKLGVIWIDTHPDVTTPQYFFNEHAMVLGNLLQAGDPEVASLVKNPLTAKQILYVGLQPLLENEVQELARLGIDYQVQDQQMLSVEQIKAWVEQNGFTHLAVHLDLDVLSPVLFQDVYFAEPGRKDFPASAGKMSPAYLQEVMSELQDNYSLVGLTIAEYLPWGAQYINQLFAKLNIFK